MSERALDSARAGSPKVTNNPPVRGGAAARFSPEGGHELLAVVGRRAPVRPTEIELGRHDDPQEREAGGIAERAMRTPAVGSPPGRPAEAPGPGRGVAPPVVHEVLGSPGTPLDGSTRALFEARLGADLSDVRVHLDARADASARAVDAAAYTVGADIVIASGRYTPTTPGGRLLLGHELAHVLQQRTAATGLAPRLARQDAVAATTDTATADELVDSFSGLVTVDTEALGGELRRRAVLGERDLVVAVLDSLSFFNRHWVAVAFAGEGSEPELEWLGQTPEGRAVLALVLDGATRYWVGQAETEASDRISAALVASRPAADVEREIVNTMVFPFKLPGLTVNAPAALSAEQRPGGRIWVSQNAVVFYSGAYADEVATLPTEVFTTGLVIPGDQIVGIRMYDLGGQVIYKPAAFLLQLSNATTSKILGDMLTTAGFALGGVGAVAEESAGLVAGALLWADRLALSAQAITTLLADHRGWIIARFGTKGETFLGYVDMVNSALALYGGARALLGMAQLLLGLRNAIVAWRASASLLEDELTAAEQIVVLQAADEADAIVSEVDEIARAQVTVDQTAIGSPSPAEGAGIEVVTAEPLGAPPLDEMPTVAPQRGTTACFVAGTDVLTPEGRVPIESLGVGDLVLARDPETGIESTAVVTDAHAREAPGVLVLTIGRATVSVTGEHPFWVSEVGWRSAGELSEGTLLQCESGGDVLVQAVASSDCPTTVHNLTVSGANTYFVSPAAVLVHNKNGGRAAPPTEAELPAAKVAGQASALDDMAAADRVIEKAATVGDVSAVEKAGRLRDELGRVRDSFSEAETPYEFLAYEESRQALRADLDQINATGIAEPLPEPVPLAGAPEADPALAPATEPVGGEAPAQEGLVPEAAGPDAPPVVEALLADPFRDIVRGERIGSGGNKDVFAVVDQPDLVIAVLRQGHESKIDAELELLDRLRSQSLPTVEVLGRTTSDGRPAFVMRRYAAGSKTVVKLSQGKVRVVRRDSVEALLLNEKSIADLDAIERTMRDSKVRVNDLQFLVGADGSVVIADPLDVTLGASPSPNNLAMIRKLREVALGNVSARGGQP